jgi:valine--pyruvate aminotransferase
MRDGGLFKYRVDFETLEVGDDIGAICVSRPTNPTGNVLTDDELAHLDRIAQAKGIPLIVDNAYGLPFPSIIFTGGTPVWHDNIIMCLSLSKFGLPGLRTGIVIAREEVIEALSKLNAIVNLAPGSFGAALTTPLVKSGEILQLGRDVIKPFYEQKAWQAVDWLREALGDYPVRIHVPEGAIFLWLWFEGLPITSAELYQRLKQRRVIVVPGEYFFPGLEHDDWQHKHECIRMTYSQDEATVREGIRVIAEEVIAAFDEAAG